MAYRLSKDEPVAHGLERILRKELRSALTHLNGEALSEKDIHEARKSIKKVRAVLELVGHELGAEREVKRLQRAGRLLSPLRDADAMLASTTEFCGRHRPALTAQTCAAIRDLLQRHKEHVVLAAARDRSGIQAAKLLKTVRRAAKHWTTKNAGYSVVIPGIQRSYKEARLAMAVAARADGPQRADDYHTWRKRVKTLWYALRLLERRMPHLGRRLADLKRLETWLGEDHNLSTLRAKVAASRRIGRNQQARARVNAVADHRQEELKQQALAIGARLFTDKPKRFMRDLRHLSQHRDIRPGDGRRATKGRAPKARPSMAHDR